MLKLTVEQAKKAVKELSRMGDDEVMHSYEDSLYHDFIEAMSEGSYTLEEAKAVAKILHTTEKIEFERWYA